MHSRICTDAFTSIYKNLKSQSSSALQFHSEVKLRSAIYRDVWESFPDRKGTFLDAY